MNRDKLKELYEKYELTKDDVFKHSHYTIITRSGIDKIQAVEGIKIDFEVINCEPTFAVIKANANSNGLEIQTFGSALKGNTHKDGNCNTWYVMEMAEKRAMSRAVLKLTGFYALGVFGEDESEDFKRQPKYVNKIQENNEELLAELQEVYDKVLVMMEVGDVDPPDDARKSIGRIGDIIENKQSDSYQKAIGWLSNLLD